MTTREVWFPLINFMKVHGLQKCAIYLVLIMGMQGATQINLIRVCLKKYIDNNIISQLVIRTNQNIYTMQNPTHGQF